MYPPVCFSCGRPLGHLWVTFFRLVEEGDEGSPNPDFESDAKRQALIKLKIGDECCRRMLVCQIK